MIANINTVALQGTSSVNVNGQIHMANGIPAFKATRTTLQIQSSKGLFLENYSVKKLALNLYIMLILQVFMNNSERKEKLETRILSSRAEVGLCLTMSYLNVIYLHTQKEEKLPKSLMELFSSFGRVINADLHELQNVTGMKDGALANIFCLKEIFHRILKGKLKNLSILDNREELLKYFKVPTAQSRKESLRVVHLDRSGHLIYEYIRYCGTIDRVPLYVREIIKQGLLIDAASVVISHNHPSGDIEPSKEDEDNTLSLAATCENVGMKFIDHIIVTQKSHFSFYDSGLL